MCMTDNKDPKNVRIDMTRFVKDITTKDNNKIVIQVEIPLDEYDRNFRKYMVNASDLSLSILAHREE